MSTGRNENLGMWDKLEINYHDFISSNAFQVTYEEDEKAYQLSCKAVNQMIVAAHNAQESWNKKFSVANLFSWASWSSPSLSDSKQESEGILQQGLKARNAFKDNFGPDEIPPVKGPKSLAFLRDVILPHIRNCHNIEFSQAFSWICLKFNIDLVAEKAHLKALIETYERIIEESNFTDTAAASVKHDNAGDAANRQNGEKFRLFRSGSAVSVSAPALAAAIESDHNDSLRPGAQ